MRGDAQHGGPGVGMRDPHWHSGILDGLEDSSLAYRNLQHPRGPCRMDGGVPNGRTSQIARKWGCNAVDLVPSTSLGSRRSSKRMHQGCAYPQGGARAGGIWQTRPQGQTAHPLKTKKILLPIGKAPGREGGRTVIQSISSSQSHSEDPRPIQTPK